MDQSEYARLETRDGHAVVLEGVTARGDLRGLLFEARVEQRFRNPGDQSVEVVYTFPLPAGAVLLDVEVQLGEERLAGTVVEKRQAEARYEEALSDGDAAIMLERNHDQTYSLNLGNLAPREACVVTLRYAQTLRFEQGGLRLLLPTVIAPRYGDATTDAGLQPHQAPAHSLTSDYPFDIELGLHGDLAHARVASPSHPIRVAAASPETGNVLTVSLARRGALDRDFVLVVDELAHASLAVAAHDCVEPDTVVALASFSPRIPAAQPATVAVKILVDCSGSMAGDSMNAAKRALQAIVLQLEKGDRYSLSRFGSRVEHRSRGLWSTTEATRLAAQRWVGNLNADLDGTEMEGALASTFALAQTVASDVLLVTDGQINAIDSTIAAAKESGHRLFVVGIGASPAESHLRRLALATGGACDFVAPGEAVEPAVLRMFARLRSPRLTDLSVVWPGDADPQWMSPLGSAVFDGDTVSVFAQFKQLPAGEVRLTGSRLAGAMAEVVGSASLGTVLDSGDTLPRMAAWQRVTANADLVSPDPVLTRLAVDYRLVTHATNFLLVHARADADKPADMPALYKVRQMVPAGWGATGSVMRSPRLDDALYGVAICRSAPVMDPFSLPSGFTRDMLDQLAESLHGSSQATRRAQVDAFQDSAGHEAEMPASRISAQRTFNRATPGYWCNSESYTGLTPMGLTGWLRITPREQWPADYAGLRRIGLGSSVVEWLEMVLAVEDGNAAPEQQVVEAFLSVMAQTRAGADRAPEAGAQGAVARMTAQLVALMNGSTGETWPEPVFALEPPHGVESTAPEVA